MQDHMYKGIRNTYNEYKYCRFPRVDGRDPLSWLFLRSLLTYCQRVTKEKRMERIHMAIQWSII